MMPRQTGKSTSAAGYLLWYAMFKPDSTILVAAHKYAGAQEIMQRVRYSVMKHVLIIYVQVLQVITKVQ